jgi:hypothetical protein
VRAASRQVWLAGLGAVVVSREWAGKEAGRVLGRMVREGTVVESRVLRFVGNRVEGSVGRANAIIGRARSTLRTAVKDYADTALTLVRETLPRIPVPAPLRLAKPSRNAGTPRRKAAKGARAAKRTRSVKRTKGAAKRA